MTDLFLLFTVQLSIMKERVNINKKVKVLVVLKLKSIVYRVQTTVKNVS